MSEDTQLVTLPESSALDIFTIPNAIDFHLAKVRAHIDAFVPDMASNKGRKEIASFAYKVTQSKTYLEMVGKRLADEQKEIPKKIDATRRHIAVTLDAWRDEVRKPLTDWEFAEDARIAKHEKAIDDIRSLSILPTSPSSIISEALAEVEAVEVGAHCEEYEAAYAEAKAVALEALRGILAFRLKDEADQSELAYLRAAKAERDAKDAEQRAAEAAAAAARQKEADEKARAEAAILRDTQREEQAAKDALHKAELDRALAERLAAQAAEAAANQRRKEIEAELKAKREAEAKAAAKAAADAAEQKRRETDREYKASVHNETVASLVLKAEIDPVTAKRIVSLIVKREIDHVTINY